MRNSIYWWYAAVLCAYLPGVLFLLRSKHAARFPILLFTFAGMFVFNALGSIGVLRQGVSISGVPLVNVEFLYLLILQVLLFYAVAGIFIWLGRNAACEVQLPGSADRIFQGILVVLIVGILGGYFLETRHFLLFDVLEGRVESGHVLEYRMRYSYGLANFKYYRLGFLVLPAVLAAFTVLRCMLLRKIEPIDIAMLLFCLVPQLLLGEKSGLVHVGLVGIIAYSTAVSFRQARLSSLLDGRIAAGMIALLIPTFLVYGAYDAPRHAELIRAATAEQLKVARNPVFLARLGEGSSESDARESAAKEYPLSARYFLDLAPSIGEKFIYRVFIAYSEALALSVSFRNEYGELRGQTLPNVRGLLPHKQVLIEALMHSYAYDEAKAHRLMEYKDEFAGSFPVPAAAEGYINFGWAGFVAFALAAFLIAALLDELFRRVRTGVLGIAIACWYGYLGMTLAQTGLFATFISLIHTGVALVLILLYWGTQRVFGSTSK